jgi:F-type H+-transporting ATPase subunit delta
MRETTVARSYAEALLELAVAEEAVEEYDRQLGALAELIRAEEEFRLLLETPRIDADEKKRIIGEMLRAKIPDRLLRFLFVVIDKRRQRLLPEMAAEFSDLADDHFGRLKVEITTAMEPDEGTRERLRERLGYALQRDVLPRYRVNPAILGGVIVRVEDRIMDGSIRHRLQGLRRQLLKAEIDKSE